MKIKICEECGKDIVNPHSNQKYHKECFKIVIKDYWKNRQKKPEVKEIRRKREKQRTKEKNKFKIWIIEKLMSSYLKEGYSK